MAWARLRERLGFAKPSAPIPILSPERVRAAIERNDLLGGEKDAVEAILANGRSERLNEGEKLITQGNQDDDVYFIVSGAVRVLVGPHHCDTRKATQVVGEMAAGSPGASRTANVIVDRGGATVLRVRGEVFRSVLRASPDIKARYNDRYEEVARQNMEFISRPRGASGPAWWMISAGIGLAASAAVFALGLGYGWSWPDIGFMTAGTGAAAFAGMMFMDAPRLVLSLCLAAGFAIVYSGAMSVLPEGSLVISPEWAPGISVDLEFGRTLSLAEQFVWLLLLLVVFFGAWRMYRDIAAGYTKSN